MPDNPAPKPINSKTGPLPESALYDEVAFDPDVEKTLSPEMKEWLNRVGRGPEHSVK